MINIKCNRLFSWGFNRQKMFKESSDEISHLFFLISMVGIDASCPELSGSCSLWCLVLGQTLPVSSLTKIELMEIDHAVWFFQFLSSSILSLVLMHDVYVFYRIHSKQTTANGVIGFKNFFPIMDNVFSKQSLLPSHQQKKLLALYPRIKVSYKPYFFSTKYSKMKN